MVEIILLALLIAGLVGLIAVGVEDSREIKLPAYETMSPWVAPWENSLPGRKPLPWESTEIAVIGEETSS